MDLRSILFSGWLPLLRVLVIGACGYFFLLAALRVAGPRTLARTNVFDFIILVSIGSVFGRILTAKDVALLEALFAYAFIVGIHYLISFFRARSARIASLLDAEPLLLFYQGRYLRAAMRRARIRAADVEAAVRQKGLESMQDVHAVVLEGDGALSIEPIRSSSTGDPSGMRKP